MTDSEQSPVEVPAEIVAHRGVYYRNTRILVTGMVLVMGCWFLYDGFIGYPAYNEKFAQSSAVDQVRMDKPHQDKDIEIQRYLAFGLLPLGAVMAIWFCYISRGAYRLSGDSLSIPGHPTLLLGAITEVDKSKWDRKGIAYVDYRLADGITGTFKLDDFVYERKPTDEILARIEAVCPADEGEPVAADDPQQEDHSEDA